MGDGGVESQSGQVEVHGLDSVFPTSARLKTRTASIGLAIRQERPWIALRCSSRTEAGIRWMYRFLELRSLAGRMQFLDPEQNLDEAGWVDAMEPVRPGLE
jgi:hypothetical protein